MKKIINWTKRWSFLLLIGMVGVCYLTVYDYWQVYAAPFEQLQDWLSTEDVDVPPESGQDGTVSDADMQISEGDLQESIVEEPAEVPEAEMETVSEADQEKAEVYKSVEDDYFQDAVFIGDSRTVGLCEYTDLKEISTFYASTGLTVYKMFDAPIVEVEGQKEKSTVEEALSENTFSKIYLMIGINEMGTGTVDSFMETYSQAVEHLKELQPDAIIYLQGIMKVTTERSQEGDYINNAGIEERNAKIAELADNVNVFYLDVNSVLCDETGGMEASYTFDGVHLKAQYASIWKDYLKANAVDFINQTDGS